MQLNSNLITAAMKKFLVMVVAMVLCSTATFAQQKGDMYIGGSAGVSIQSIGSGEDGYILPGFGLQPEFGYFVTNRLKVGASLGYAFESGLHLFTVMPNISYYARLCDGLYYTPGLEFGLALASLDGYTIPGVGLSLHLFTLEFRPTEHFGFSANLLSLNFIALTSEGETSSVVDFNLGMTPSIGFKYYF